MKNIKFEWNFEKNEWLRKERHISFEQVIFHLLQGDVWKIAEHPDQKKYPDQKIYFVIIDQYICLVPFIETDNEIFLKTIIPSRKATRDYLQELEEPENEI